MTEDEAKTKWCPMVRTGLVAGMAVNHHIGTVNGPHAGDVHDETRCIGSGCMMWRFVAVSSQTIVRGADKIRNKGYCGLAGNLHA
jgi:hypothetical protein